MSSRDFILDAVKKNKPESLPLPRLPKFGLQGDNLTKGFTDVLTSIGGQVFTVSSMTEVVEWLGDKVGRKIVGIPGLAGFNAPDYLHCKASQLEDVGWVVLKAALGVAENGAVWLDEKALYNRLLPFICEELVVVIEEHTIVDTMHEAYSRLQTNAQGYGLFIAGPSKTADIEQSLVIGAHGPLSLHLFILRNEKIQP